MLDLHKKALAIPFVAVGLGRPVPSQPIFAFCRQLLLGNKNSSHHVKAIHPPSSVEFHLIPCKLTIPRESQQWYEDWKDLSTEEIKI